MTRMKGAQMPRTRFALAAALASLLTASSALAQQYCVASSCVCDDDCAQYGANFVCVIPPTPGACCAGFDGGVPCSVPDGSVVIGADVAVVPIDAHLVIGDGTLVGNDVASPVDAGGSPDAASVQPDLGSPDAVAHMDAGADGAEGADGSPYHAPSSSGCSCAVGSAPAPGPFSLGCALAILALLALRGRDWTAFRLR